MFFTERSVTNIYEMKMVRQTDDTRRSNNGANQEPKTRDKTLEKNESQTKHTKLIAKGNQIFKIKQETMGKITSN